MSNEELIAEARATALTRFQMNDEDMESLLSRLADALEAQSAPLVADSREALARSMNGEDIYTMAGPAMLSETGAERLADALLASGVVSLAADRDRAVAERAWDEGERHESEFLDRVGQFCPYKNCNPYRESEGK